MKKRVVIFYTSAGSGHLRTAKSLQKLLETHFGWEVKLVNFYQEIFAGHINGEMIYNFLFLKCQYYILMALAVKVITFLFKTNHTKYKRTCCAYLKKLNPDLVISVMPFANKVIGQAIGEVLPQVPFIVLLTDFAEFPKKAWFAAANQITICGTTQAYQIGKALNYANHQLYLTPGLLIDKQFYETTMLDALEERK